MPVRSKATNAKRGGAAKAARVGGQRKVGTAPRDRVARRSRGTPLDVIEDERGRRALALRARLGLNRETFARLIPASTRSVAAIEAGQVAGESVRRKLREIDRLVEALSGVIRAEVIGPWLIRPNEAFGGLKPLEVIERGEIDRLWRMVYEVGSGMPG